MGEEGVVVGVGVETLVVVYYGALVWVKALIETLVEALVGGIVGLTVVDGVLDDDWVRLGLVVEVRVRVLIVVRWLIVI